MKANHADSRYFEAVWLICFKSVKNWGQFIKAPWNQKLIKMAVVEVKVWLSWAIFTLDNRKNNAHIRQVFTEFCHEV